MPETCHSEAWVFTGEWCSEVDRVITAKLWRVTPLGDDRARPQYEAVVYRHGVRVATLRADGLDELTLSLNAQLH